MDKTNPTPPDTLTIDGHKYRRVVDPKAPEIPLRGAYFKQKGSRRLYIAVSMENVGMDKWSLINVHTGMHYACGNGWGGDENDFVPVNIEIKEI